MNDRPTANMWTCGHVDKCGRPFTPQPEKHLKTGTVPKNAKNALPAYIDKLSNLFISYARACGAGTCPHVHIVHIVHSYGKGEAPQLHRSTTTTTTTTRREN